MVKHLDHCIQSGDVPNWMVENWAVSIQKDSRKENAVGNCRPISRLNLLWKLQTGIINENVFDHINQQNLLPEEQKGCRRKTRGAKDQLLIGKEAVRNTRRRKTNLNVGRIDFRKVYNMVPGSWIKTLKTLELVGTSRNISELLKRSTQCWRTVLFSGKNKLVNIRPGLFQGDSMSPLL